MVEEFKFIHLNTLSIGTEKFEKVKQDWLETYNLELTDDEITIDSVEEVA